MLASKIHTQISLKRKKYDYQIFPSTFPLWGSQGVITAIRDSDTMFSKIAGLSSNIL